MITIWFFDYNTNFRNIQIKVDHVFVCVCAHAYLCINFLSKIVFHLEEMAYWEFMCSRARVSSVYYR